MLLGELKVGDKFSFARKENSLNGVYTLVSISNLCKFANEMEGGRASKYSEVIKID